MAAAGGLKVGVLAAGELLGLLQGEVPLEVVELCIFVLLDEL